MIERARIKDKKPEAKGNNRVPKEVQRSIFSPPVKSPTNQIMFLQRTIGNQAVLGLFRSGIVQAKLKIGQPGNIYEQEADRPADQGIRMFEADIQPKPT